MHNALDIAKYIINKCIELRRPVSNLQLQKILYYVQGEFMKNNDGEALFQDDIMAWQYGPVVPDVYYTFNGYSSSDITNYQGNVQIDQSERDVIDPVIISKSNLNAWTLVEQTHSEFPWRDTYNNGEKIITKEKMREFFCN
ncbi:MULTISPECIES: Panacea domain-containing protein [Clostridium]|uniref:Panacea domain-containing protein n=1 Tax=Clostridium TaxID=1485 RepID=UPI0008240539|nr:MULTISPECIES: type II toxin-antitoxin system antitoxin SocA domain-containing protein [Clostridium]PJI08309.1 DUF4065 domain-containing protein [Clostridium sp. CT7]